MKEHQLDMLASFTDCTGVGFLLVCFERPDLAKTFACTARWFQDQLDGTAHRCSIPFDTFEHAAGVAGKECCQVFHGENGVPVNFGHAAWRLRVAISGQA